MMFERLSSTISNSAADCISHNVLISGTSPHSLSVGCKIEFAFAQLLDVDSSDGRAVFSTISQLKCSSLILAWNFFN